MVNQVLKRDFIFCCFEVYELVIFHRNNLLTDCWRKEPDYRPAPCKILMLFNAHPAMIAACLDSPMSSVATDEDWNEPDNISRNGSIRTRRGTPSPSASLKRKCTMPQLTQEHFKVLMPPRKNGDSESRLWMRRWFCSLNERFPFYSVDRVVFTLDLKLVFFDAFSLRVLSKVFTSKQSFLIL